MKTINYPIDESVYINYIKADTYGEKLNIIEPTLSRSIILGYGFYGCGKPIVENGKYYVEIRIGNSCD